MVPHHEREVVKNGKDSRPRMLEGAQIVKNIKKLILKLNEFDCVVTTTNWMTQMTWDYVFVIF